MSTTTATNSQRKTAPALLRTIWALAHRWRIAEDELREINMEVNHTRRLSRMSDPQANRLIARLGGKESLPAQPSRRTVQHVRQINGVVQTKTAAHLIKLNNLARQCGLDEAGQRAFCLKQIGVQEPRTTKETNRVIEPLKAMYKRGWRATQILDQETEAA